MTVAIRFEDVSKLYRLGEVGTGTLSHDLQRAWARFRGKPDPFAKVGAVNDRERKAGDGEDYAWALRDISLDIHQGEIVGIIGRNGAGKSTLLKLLSRVTAPTSGRILTKGRIASLLEVGTGFHPELTGRENIYLNGAILGMRRHEIDRKLEEIVEFSGCAKYIDTPVKRYSSGMTVRLGFAVAAHLDCEILVVDEVLAVGDADFQKKCLARMQDMQGDGRTVLFVSHQMSMISALCSRGVMLMNGQIFYDGDVQSAILRYQPSISNDVKHVVFDATKDHALQAGDKRSRLLRVWAESEDGVISRSFDRSDEINVCFDCELCAGTTEWPNANIHLFDSFGSHVFCVSNRMKGSDHERRQGGNYRIKCNIPAELLNTGTYTVGVAVVYMSGGANAAFWIPQALSIHVGEDLTLTIDKERCGYAGPIPGPIRPILDWSIDRLEKDELSVGSEATHTSDQLN